MNLENHAEALQPFLIALAFAAASIILAFKITRWKEF